MRKSIAAAVAALTFGGTVASVAAPAQAQGYYDYNGVYRDYGRSHKSDTTSTAIIAGIAGLAIGAALASSSHKTHNAYAESYYDPQYGQDIYGDYSSGYWSRSGLDGYGSSYDYNRGYGYSSGYRTCERTEQTYDPYSGRHVIVRRAYAC